MMTKTTSGRNCSSRFDLSDGETPQLLPVDLHRGFWGVAKLHRTHLDQRCIQYMCTSPYISDSVVCGLCGGKHSRHDSLSTHAPGMLKAGTKTLMQLTCHLSFQGSFLQCLPILAACVQALLNDCVVSGLCSGKHSRHGSRPSSAPGTPTPSTETLMQLTCRLSSLDYLLIRLPVLATSVRSRCIMATQAQL